MKTFKVFHQNGSLFNIETGEKLNLREKKEFVIIGDDNAFDTIDVLNLVPNSTRNPQEMLEYITDKYTNKGCIVRKIYSAGCVFEFSVGISKHKQNNQEEVYRFSCTILEDLYAYIPKNDSFPRLCFCQCVVDNCLSENIKYFNEMYGSSLNEVASKTITQYAPMQRSSSFNVLSEFYLIYNSNSVEKSKVNLPNLKEFVRFTMS